MKVKSSFAAILALLAVSILGVTAFGQPPGAGTGQEKSRASKEQPKQTKLRTWTDSTGKYKVEAAFIELKDGKAVLRREDGKTVGVTVEKLSKADQDLVKSLAETPPREGKPKESRQLNGGAKTPLQDEASTASKEPVRANGNKTAALPKLTVSVENRAADGERARPEPVVLVSADWQTVKNPSVAIVLSFGEKVTLGTLVPTPSPFRDTDGKQATMSPEMLVTLFAGMAQAFGAITRGRVDLREGGSLEIVAWKNRLGRASACAVGFVEGGTKKERIGAQAWFCDLKSWAREDGSLQLEPHADYFSRPGRMDIYLMDGDKTLCSQSISWGGL